MGGAAIHQRQNPRYRSSKRHVRAGAKRRHSHNDGALVSAIQDQLLAGVAELMPPNIAASEVWQAALAWLSRDQECRFGHALEWRQLPTESLLPVRDLSKEHTLQIVRAIIGAITGEELLVQRRA